MLDSYPANASGLALNNDLKALASRAPYSATVDPTANNDSADTAGLGIQFAAGDRWWNSTDGILWQAAGVTAGAAVWNAVGALPVVTRSSSNTSTTPLMINTIYEVNAASRRD
ncbi:MAG TPA: hypothetical protein VFE24_10030 [Pirellulales bacterium]|nr:hypothetical protein [Pirellulales bacterium]